MSFKSKLLKPWEELIVRTTGKQCTYAPVFLSKYIGVYKIMLKTLQPGYFMNLPACT